MNQALEQSAETSSLQAEWYVLKPSWQARVLNFILKYLIKPFITYAPINAKSMERTRQMVHRSSLRREKQPLPPGHELHLETIKHIPAEWHKAHENVKDDHVVLYFHGGGYFFGSPLTHRSLTSRLSREANARVVAIDYRKAPEFDLPHALEDALIAYEHLLEQGYYPEQIAFAGDSAGGNLVLAALQTLRNNQAPLPKAAICLSPWGDLSASGESLRKHHRHDPMFPGNAIAKLSRHYAQERDPRDPIFSPVHGDFSQLPPLLIFVGHHEVLFDDARRIAEQAHAQGVPTRFKIWKNMPHVFPVFADFLPEGKQGIREMGQFLRQQWEMD